MLLLLLLQDHVFFVGIVEEGLEFGRRLFEPVGMVE